MSVFPGTYIPTGVASSAHMNHLIDELLTPRLASFRQICIYDELAVLCPDKSTWEGTFANWLEGFKFRFWKNNQEFDVSSLDSIDYLYGTFVFDPVDLGADGRTLDTMEISYAFDYFPVAVLEGLFKAAVQIVNSTAVGPPTNFKIGSNPEAPEYWDGVLVDLVFAMCMEKLLLDYDLWKYRLVFAIGPNEVYQGGGGDITGTLETLKQNAEQRAEQTLQNEKFKSGNYLAPPTAAYFASISGGVGGGIHGIPFLSGRLRGWKPNSYI